MVEDATYAVITRQSGPFGDGELVVLNGHGREIGSPGRDPGKWDCDWREFDTLEEARAFLRSDRFPFVRATT